MQGRDVPARALSARHNDVLARSLCQACFHCLFVRSSTMMTVRTWAGKTGLGPLGRCVRLQAVRKRHSCAARRIAVAAAAAGDAGASARFCVSRVPARPLLTLRTHSQVYSYQSGMQRPQPQVQAFDAGATSPGAVHASTMLEESLPSLSPSPLPPPRRARPDASTVFGEGGNGTYKYVGGSPDRPSPEASERGWTSRIPQGRTVVPSFFGSKILLQVVLAMHARGPKGVQRSSQAPSYAVTIF